MPSSVIAKLSNVAMEYLRNYDELEAARELFRAERKKLLDCFGSFMLEAAAQHNQVIVEHGCNDTYGLFDVYARGQFLAARAKTGKEKQSGYSTGLGSYLGHVGAQTLLWFEMKLTPSRHRELEISALEKALGADVRAIGEGAWLYLRTVAQPPPNLDMEAFEGEVRRLPELFATADAWIAKRFGD